MIIDFQYVYFALTIPFIAFWLLFFIFSKRTRKEQLIMSILFLPAGTIAELLYFQDYWNPGSILSTTIGPIRILLEDFLFVFAIAGIGAVIYEIVFGKKLLKMRKSVNKIFAFSMIIVISVLASCLLFFIGINSIFATSVGFIIAALFFINQRTDLLINSLLSGVAVMFIMFISYFILFNVIMNTETMIRQGWLLYGTSLDFRIFGIPFTEMIWGFAWGMLLGPLYEFVKGVRTI